MNMNMNSSVTLFRRHELCNLGMEIEAPLDQEV